MKKNNIAVILILAVSAVLFTLGVVKKIQHRASGADKAKRIIAVIPKGTASMWWEVVRKGAEQAGKEEGYTISWNGPEQETDREKQIQSVEDALTRGIVALVLGPNDSKALVRPVDKAKSSGIPVVIIDSSIETDNYDSFAATDNVAGGADAAGQGVLDRLNLFFTIRFLFGAVPADAVAFFLAGLFGALADDFPPHGSGAFRDDGYGFSGLVRAGGHVLDLPDHAGGEQHCRDGEDQDDRDVVLFHEGSDSCR